MKELPIEVIYATLAIMGGIARYLKGFIDGKKFSIGIFIASAIVAGFSGFMFALLGESLNLPSAMLSVMAGVGGFFGDQTVKFIMETIQRKVQ